MAMGKTAVAGRGLKMPKVNCPTSRCFSESRRLLVVKPVLLADIGEGDFPQDVSPLLFPHC
jgi:hypothetical protein